MDRFSKSLSNERAGKLLSTVSIATSEATAGSKRKREPEPALEPVISPEQGFDWQGLPPEVRNQILERVCHGSYAHMWFPSRIHDCANDTALAKRSVSKEFRIALRDFHASVYIETLRRTNQRRTFCLLKSFHEETGRVMLRKQGLGNPGRWY